LAAYAGIVPSTYASGGKTYHGRIIKQGNKWLRWAFIEAVAPTVASDPELKELYQRLSATGSNRAKVAVTCRLLTIAFQVLREGRSYEYRRTREEPTSTSSRLS
jgi:transposase